MQSLKKEDLPEKLNTTQKAKNLEANLLERLKILLNIIYFQTKTLLNIKTFLHSTYNLIFWYVCYKITPGYIRVLLSYYSLVAFLKKTPIKFLIYDNFIALSFNNGLSFIYYVKTIIKYLFGTKVLYIPIKGGNLSQIISILKHGVDIGLEEIYKIFVAFVLFKALKFYCYLKDILIYNMNYNKFIDGTFSIEIPSHERKYFDYYNTLAEKTNLFKNLIIFGGFLFGLLEYKLYVNWVMYFFVRNSGLKQPMLQITNFIMISITRVFCIFLHMITPFPYFVKHENEGTELDDSIVPYFKKSWFKKLEKAITYHRRHNMLLSLSIILKLCEFLSLVLYYEYHRWLNLLPTGIGYSWIIWYYQYAMNLVGGRLPFN